MNDLISRQRAIEIMRKAKDKSEAHRMLVQLPSAQPEKRTENTRKTHGVCLDAISRRQAIRWVKQECSPYGKPTLDFESGKRVMEHLERMPSVQPERKTGHWILDRSGAYCCSKCMEPCATYAMMKPRDKFCKMCGSRNEVME